MIFKLMPVIVDFISSLLVALPSYCCGEVLPLGLSSDPRSRYMEAAFPKNTFEKQVWCCSLRVKLHGGAHREIIGKTFFAGHDAREGAS